MVKKLFRQLFDSRQGAEPDEHPESVGHLERQDFPSPARAAELLAAPYALAQLTLAESRVVVSYMRPRHIPAGTMFIREGDDHNTGFMVLVLEGDVVVESIVVSRVSPITLTVLGAGSLHGDLGLIDGLPRSASCTASTDISCAVLTRESLLKLLKDKPAIAAKLMMSIAVRMGERVRDNNDKLKKYVQLTKAMQQEIDHLMPG
jgi:CRP/FNR family transcriptional regulator, cyclic AMP receptor protein